MASDNVNSIYLFHFHFISFKHLKPHNSFLQYDLAIY